ncbi:endonuclease [Metamycoplasma hominis]|uniref:endonuclease n=1 Tax=Metamycoplasma hominis TaxID=2098 RepID=UPI00215D9767|nr:endonuclease [Metamycoplasma hominis]
MKKTKKIFLTMGAILPLLISTPLVAAGCVKPKNPEVKLEGEKPKTTPEKKPEVKPEGEKPGTTPEKSPEVKPEKPKMPEAKPLDNKIIYDNSNDFYKSLDGLSGQNLRDNLFALQKAHRNHSTKYKDLFNTYKDAFVDKYYEKDGSVLDIYEEIPDKEDVFTNWHGKYRDQGKHEGDGMNREHLVPQSWFGKSAPMRTDAHHVWPTDKLVNAWHANYPYGTVKELQGNKISKNGTKTGLSVEDGGPVTEPINEFKGDVARAYLYFCLSYNDLNITSSNQATRVFKKINEKNTITPIFLKTFLAWNNLDKVSKFDIDRNNGVYKHQGNRNPFIDYPELIDVVYNNNNDYVFKNKGIAIGLNK